jgi:hypothetical protein
MPLSLGDLVVSVRAETREAVAGFSNLLGSVKSLLAEGMRLAQGFNQIEDAQLRVAMAANRVEDAQRRVQRVEAELNDARERLRSATEAVASLEAKREQVLRDHQAALEAVRQAERELEHAKAASGARSEEAKAKEQALKEARKALSEAEKELKDVTSDLERAKREQSKADEEQRKKSEDLKAAQEDLRLAQERLNNAQQSVTMAGMQLGMAFLTMTSHLFTLHGATQGMTAAQYGLNAAMAANPIGAVITAVTMLISLLVMAYQNCEPFRNAVNGLWDALVNFFKPALEAVKGAWDSFVGALRWGYETFIKPVIDAIVGFFNWVEDVKSGIAGFFTGLFGGGGAGAAAGGAAAGYVPPEAAAAMARAGVPGLQSGGIVTAPTLAFLGEHGPEAVIPLERLPSMTIQFNAPLVNVEGSADKRTAEYAARLVVEKLKTVLIEPTSQSAPTKRIYIPGGF